MVKKLIALLCAVALSGCALNPLKKDVKPPPADAPPVAQKTPRVETPEFWRKDGKAIAKQAQKGLTSRTKAKNLILFVGDGMGVSTVTAARILLGQEAGLSGEEEVLSFEAFPSTALAKTYNYDLQTPQPGGAMTALMTGIKTRGSSIGLTQIPVQDDCDKAKGQAEPTLLEAAKNAQMAAGLVTTARITAAAPAAAYAHISNPNWEVDATMTDRARAENCLDIARQLTAFNNHGPPMDIVFGGGWLAFSPPRSKEEKDPQVLDGVRRAPEQLIRNWVLRGSGRRFIRTSGELEALIKTPPKGPILGLFAPDHMSFEAGRRTENPGLQPSLTQMTEAAVRSLRLNKNGYVLVVVAAGIGRGHEKANAYLALHDAVELSNAVAKAVELTQEKDTLIVVTAQHGSTLAFGGAPIRGNPILARDAGANGPLKDVKDQLYTALTYGNGPKPPATIKPPPTENKLAADLQQAAAVALPVAATGGEDVPVYARGPGSQWFHGTLDQHALFWLMRDAVPTLENGKPPKKVAGVTVPKVPKLKLPFGKKDKPKKE